MYSPKRTKRNEGTVRHHVIREATELADELRLCAKRWWCCSPLLCLCEESKLKGRRRDNGVWLRSAGSAAGGGGNFANSLEGPVYSLSLFESRELLAFKSAGLAAVGVAGELGDGSTLTAEDMLEEGEWWRMSGSVPDRFRVSACLELEDGLGDMRGCGVPRSCAAEADGRRSLRGATDPTVTNEWMDVTSSSPDFAPDDIVDPFIEGASVDVVAALPLLWRSLYFSIASASRSRMRLAMGDNPGATAVAGASAACCCGVGEGTLRILLLPTELADGCGGDWGYGGSGVAFRDGESEDNEGGM